MVTFQSMILMVLQLRPTCWIQCHPGVTALSALVSEIKKM